LIDDAAVSTPRVIGVVTMRDSEAEQPDFGDVYPVGVAAVIRMMVKMPNGIRLIVQGLRRIRLIEPLQSQPYLRGRIEGMPEQTEFSGEEAVEVNALARNLSSAFEKIVQMSPDLPDELQAIPLNVPEPGLLADLIAAHMRIPTADKQQILEETDV